MSPAALTDRAVVITGASRYLRRRRVGRPWSPGGHHARAPCPLRAEASSIAAAITCGGCRGLHDLTLEVLVPLLWSRVSPARRRRWKRQRQAQTKMP